MLRRVTAAVLLAMAVGATASAPDVRMPGLDFGRYHALVIGNNDFKTASGPCIDLLVG